MLKKEDNKAPKHNVKKKYGFDDFDDSDIENFNLDNKKKKIREKNIYEKKKKNQILTNMV